VIPVRVMLLVLPLVAVMTRPLIIIITLEPAIALIAPELPPLLPLIEVLTVTTPLELVAVMVLMALVMVLGMVIIPTRALYLCQVHIGQFECINKRLGVQSLFTVLVHKTVPFLAKRQTI